ncbi:CoA transferase [Dactylosporangium sp. NPDC000555]|uniref:CaiB/BaiF CoA transferase family protein n=1 Tax=Dactylosporangium sp. NPDC000555 TaxID=3154260 RepID=UPI0033268952
MTGPLDGIRVVDLTVAWSGPGATALLGDLGAEVIRIEGSNRASRQASAKLTPESVRKLGWPANNFPDHDPGARPYDRSAVFNWHARNKLSANVNLESPEGREAARGLLALSDVFVENNAAGTLEKLGLGHEELLELNPRLIVVRMAAFGLSGPQSGFRGYGPNFNALVGIAAMDGYPGEGSDSAGDNNHMDEGSPAGVAFAVMCALLDREQTGLGGLIEFAQAEHEMQEIGEYLIDWQVNARVPDTLGNGDVHFFQDVFPAKEDDRWVAITVRSDREWAALGSLLGTDFTELVAEGRWRSNADALREMIGAWTAPRCTDDIVEALQGLCIPAGEVMTEQRVLQDPQLEARDWFKVRSHPNVGTHRYPGHPWRVEGGFELRYGRPVPGFGEDNEYVYKTLLGYSDEQYDALVEAGVVTDRQRV